VTDVIVEHNIESCCDAYEIEVGMWKIFFDGSVCAQGQGVRCLVVSPQGMEYKASIRLEFWCTNNQANYKTLLNGLEILLDLGVNPTDIFGDSKLVVQQMKGGMQCMDGTLNEYRERCLEMMGHMKEVHISHVSRKENAIANMLAHQALGYCVEDGKFEVRVTPGVGNALVHKIENEVDDDTGTGRID
jgi:ribonuclease HI